MNALQIQLDGLRAQQQHLYCFKLFGNRYKCGIGLDVDRRIRQHKPTCPSRYNSVLFRSRARPWRSSLEA